VRGFTQQISTGNVNKTRVNCSLPRKENNIMQDLINKIQSAMNFFDPDRLGDNEPSIRPSTVHHLLNSLKLSIEEMMRKENNK
jgi:hypothetical protein